MWKLLNLQLYRYIKNNPIWTDRQVWSSEKRRKPKFKYYVNFLKPVELKWYLICINFIERYVCKPLPKIKEKH